MSIVSRRARVTMVMSARPNRDTSSTPRTCKAGASTNRSTTPRPRTDAISSRYRSALAQGAPVLDRFGDVLRRQHVVCIQVGDRATDLQYTVISTRRPPELDAGGLQQLLHRTFRLTDPFHFARL